MPEESVIKPGKIFISGSIAYDYIMNYNGNFKDVLLPDKLENLSVSFTAEDRKIEFGGCATNIAHTVKELGGNPMIYGVAGSDFENYKKKIKKNGIDTGNIFENKDKLTATAYILSDKSENQITTFAPGAMNEFIDEMNMDNIDLSGVSIAILSPENHKRTLYVAEELIKRKIPYFFDPGQMTHVFNAEELMYLLENAYGFIANEYEVNLLQKKLFITYEVIVRKVDIFIETYASKGSSLRTKDTFEFIQAIAPQKVVDPTGSGDAFRGGVLTALVQGKGPLEACKIGALAATYNIEQLGTQNHKLTPEEFDKRFQQVWG